MSLREACSATSACVLTTRCECFSYDFPAVLRAAAWPEQWYRKSLERGEERVEWSLQIARVTRGVCTTLQRTIRVCEAAEPEAFFFHGRTKTPLSLRLDRSKACKRTAKPRLRICRTRSSTNRAVFYMPRWKSLRRRVTRECTGCLRLRHRLHRREAASVKQRSGCSRLNSNRCSISGKRHLLHGISTLRASTAYRARAP